MRAAASAATWSTSSKEGYEVFAADADPYAMEQVREQAAALASTLPAENFRADQLEQSTFLSNAVLHFAENDEHFQAVPQGTWRVLKPGGLFFRRLASSIGMEHQPHRQAGRRHLLPDSPERCLIDEARLIKLAEDLGGELLDPLKTTVVRNQRCMTTRIVRKSA